MTHEALKKEGTLIDEVDFNVNGIYAGTSYYYFYNDNIYLSEVHTNGFNYTGENNTSMIIEAEDLNKYNDDYFRQHLTEEGLKKFKELAGYNN